jgi:hypothetical protein
MLKAAESTALYASLNSPGQDLMARNAASKSHRR